jgi:rubrerythrin
VIFYTDFSIGKQQNKLERRTDIMAFGKEDLLQSLVEAFLMEKGTGEFYKEAARKAKDDQAAQMFRELESWEEKHMDFIQHLHQSITGDQEVRSFEEFKERSEAPITEAGISVADMEKKMDQYAVTDDLGALTLALEIEGKAYNMYRKLAESAEDNNAAVVFKGMMEEEVKHINYLKDMRVKLADVYN